MRKKLSFSKRSFLTVLSAALIIASLATSIPAFAHHVPYNAGDVFAGVGAGKVKHFDSAGNLLEELDTGTGSTEETGMAFDSAGNLYVTNWTNNSMSKFDNQGGLLGPFGSGFNLHPESAVFDASGNMYVGQADGARQLTKFDAAGNVLAQYHPATESRGIDWIDLAADQKTIFYTSEGTKVMRFDVSTNTQLPDFATGLTRPAFALRIRSNGEVLVATSRQVYRFDSTGATIQTYPFPTESLFALNLDPDGTSFWTGGYGSGDIYKVDIDTGALLLQFNSGKYTTLAGLAIFGEPTQGNPREIEVALDIKPTSCPNPLQTNGKGKGVVPAAILGTDSFDVTSINTTSIQLEGVSPLRWSVEDVATPYAGGLSDPADRNDCTTEGPDGFDDLTLKFDKQELVAAVGNVVNGDVVILTISGELLDGTPFSGQDVVWIVEK